MPVAFYAAWLPRSFTLNALVNITAASPPDICAFGVYLSSSSAAFAEATALQGRSRSTSADWGVTGFWKIFFTSAVKGTKENVF